MITEDYTVAAFSDSRDNSVNTAFMDFNRAASHTPDALFVFYEGQDDDYYYPRLRQYSGRSIEAIKCKGKGNVIAVYKLLITKPEYNKYHKGFFIDKDFDLHLEPFFDDFFITSGYSIENYYLSDECMEETLKQKFSFHGGDDDLKAIMTDYRTARQKYFDSILLFNTWYCAIKRKYVKIEGISLNQEMPTGFVKFNLPAGNVHSRYTITEIYSTFASAANYSVSADEMAGAEQYIRENMQMNLRGKYLLDFMTKYLNYLIDKFRTDANYSMHKRIVTIHFNNIMSILSPYSVVEQELIDYIKRVAA